MAETKFRYNPKTLRYERASVSVLSIVFSGLGYIVLGGLFFVGLVMLQNYFVETPLEKTLRAENAALIEYKVVLAASLKESNERINQLKEEDTRLYEQLFETKANLPTDNSKVEKDQILTAEPELFGEWEQNTRQQTEMLFNKAKTTNQAFSQSAHIYRSDISAIKSLPTIAPVAGFEVDKLVSGFGKRINPFHKGLYHHDGVDIALPIGIDVVASASGTVTLASQSSLVAGFGTYLEIDHGNGIITRYAHLGELKVRYGQKVIKGQTIGVVGSSGGSIAPHLHYEVIKNGKNVNPVYYIIGGLTSTQFQQMLYNSTKQNQSLD
ncbi:MAG: M23 family metallopeptidase [Cyclobacteriaceae bacterium]|nr:M23 family metallopeptidase [Cyclobacteriaceae bacterium]